MLVKTNGIVLHTIKYSETSIVSRIFTRELGLQSYMVNGVRGAKGNKAALFRAGNVLELVSYFKKEHKGLQRLKEYNFGVLYQQIPFHIIKSSLALFLIEVLNKVLKEEEPHPELYDFVEGSFRQLDETSFELGSYHLRFLAGLATELGFHPGGSYPASKPYLDLKEGHFLSHPPPHPLYLEPHLAAFFFNEETTPLSMADKRTLLDKILQFFAAHIDNFGTVKSWEILSEVLASPDKRN
ncbi:DNA repair protein RecO [soil metagenome]